MTQPWKGYSKRMPDFAKDFESALTSLVLAHENPNSLSHISQGAIDILNEHKDLLPDVMKKVQNNIGHMITYLYGYADAIISNGKLFRLCKHATR